MKIRFAGDDKVFNTHSEGIPYLSFDMLDRLGLPNLYSTRYESWDDAAGRGVTGLRTALMNGDDIHEAGPVITDTRDRLARQLGSSIEMECITDQKHTGFVHVVREEDLGTVYPDEKPLHRQYVDGLVTDIPDVLLTVFGGDCPPVYLADPVHKAIGLVHAGWKGTLARIPEVAIAQMRVRFGSDPADMYAAVGPGICRECYEMGDEVYEIFEDKWGHDAAERILGSYPAPQEERGWKYHLDLREANRMTLLRAGIPEDRIAISNVCTMCNADTFYSYRAGRMENEQVAMLVNRFGKDN
ncbi:MAG: peptidoglycan editing factor PgeF [Clostridiales bacterium]|nr:peptidoglycan editing factor PgeF [Clostridiales bacterium]